MSSDSTIRARRPSRFLLGALSAVALLAAGVASVSALAISTDSRSVPAAPQFAGPTFPPHLRAAQFALTDQNGRRITLTDYRGRVMVLSFMYSGCRDTCPLMATEIRGALDELPDAGRAVPVLAISVDPAHDTPGSARIFLAREHLTGRMQFLLGTRRELQPVWKRYAVQSEFDQSGRRYRYGHSAYVMLIDRRGFLRVGFPAGALVPEDLAHDLKLLLAQRS